MFARKIDDGLIGLVKRIDGFLVDNTGVKICGTVVILNADKDAVAPKLREVAAAQKIEHVPLTVAADGEAGPGSYNISKDAQFTFVIYDKKKKVTATFAYDSIDANAGDAALAALAKAANVAAPKKEAGDASKEKSFR